MLASDFKIKARPFHIANLESPKNPKFLAINHDTISFEPDTYKGNKKIPRCLTIIRPLAAGWASAPYKPNQKGVSKSKLSEYSNSEETGSVIKIYAFEKASSNMEKGPRSDNVTSELQAGDALKFWMDEQRLIAIKRTIPEGLTHIEPFTLCEIQVTRISECRFHLLIPHPRRWRRATRTPRSRATGASSLRSSRRRSHCTAACTTWSAFHRRWPTPSPV